jgi:hypothetical protein
MPDDMGYREPSPPSVDGAAEGEAAQTDTHTDTADQINIES